MSSAEVHARAQAGPRLRQAGHTFAEVALAITILSMLALIVERTLSSAQQSERYMAGIRKVTERGERTSYALRAVVAASRKLFQNDPIGRGYLEALELPTVGGPIPISRLPRFDEQRGLGPDTPGDPRTGNMLLFVREADAAPAVADPDTGKLRYIDTYRFVCIYATETDRSLVEDGGRQRARDLVFWRSVAYPSYDQVATISDPEERASVVRDLYERFGFLVCWDPANPVAEAFFEMDAEGNLAAAPEPDLLIELDPDLVERGRLVVGGMQLAPSDPASQPRRAVFSADDPAVWRPDGFEVKICGPSGARKIWMHLVIESQVAKGRVVAHRSTVIAHAKDL